MNVIDRSANENTAFPNKILKTLLNEFLEVSEIHKDNFMIL